MKKSNLKTVYLKEKIVKYTLTLFVFISIITTIGIVISLFTESLPFFGEGRGFQLLKFGTLWDPRSGSYHILPILVGTLMIVLFSCLFAIPLGLGSAIYLSEYANPKVRNTLKPILEILAGIPSVVYGFFALLYITPFLKVNISWIAKIFLVLFLVLSGFISFKIGSKFFETVNLKLKIISTISFYAK